MPQQGVGISVVRVDLNGPLEELDGNVMLSLQAETVSRSTPCLGKTALPNQRAFNSSVMQVELNGLFHTDLHNCISLPPRLKTNNNNAATLRVIPERQMGLNTP